MKQLLHNQTFISVASLLLVDGIFFGFTSPTRVPPWLLIVGFGLLVATLYFALQLLRQVAGIYVPWLQQQTRPVAYLTGIIAVVIALQSMGQLTIRDVVVLTVLTFVVGLYYDYSKSKTV